MSIEKVVLESSSDYWRPFFYLLEAAAIRHDLIAGHDALGHLRAHLADDQHPAVRSWPS